MDFTEVTRSTLIIGAVLSILIGIAFCFFGYRIFRVLLAVLGFLGGAAAGVAIVTAILAQQGTTSGQALYLILGGLVGGAIGAVLLIFAYIIGIFVLGAVLGATLGYAISSALTSNETVLTVAVIGLGLLGGILAIVLQRALIIISTAFSGAASIVSGVTLLVAPGRGLGLPLPTTMGPISGQFQGATVAPATTTSIVALVAWIVLAIAGMVVQFVWTGKKKPKAPVGAVPYGTVVGATPQINVTVNQQQGTPAAPVVYQPPVQQPPIIVQAPQQPMQAPLIVQAPERAVPLMPMPEQPALPAANGAAGMGRFCPNCGQPMSSPVSFCPSCGAPAAALWQ